ncbi:MAG: biotin transporter BioY [Gammaproteobacteria bacterium]
MQKLGTVLLFVLLIYAGTIIEFPIPGTTIMQTGQTIAVLCAGALLGPFLGAASVALYVLIGMLGVPVFSEGASGVAVMTGPSGGYLFGFIIAAAFVGLCKENGWSDRFLTGVVCMLIGHAVILLCGWAWMSTLMGMSAAYDNGIAPFYLGSTVKSLLAMAIVLGTAKIVSLSIQDTVQP